MSSCLCRSLFSWVHGVSDTLRVDQNNVTGSTLRHQGIQWEKNEHKSSLKSAQVNISRNERKISCKMTLFSQHLFPSFDSPSQLLMYSSSSWSLLLEIFFSESSSRKVGSSSPRFRCRHFCWTHLLFVNKLHFSSQEFRSWRQLQDDCLLFNESFVAKESALPSSSHSLCFSF